MTVSQMRNAIIKVYTGSKTWKKRVEKMHDEQVIAIYYDFEKKGRFKEKIHKPNPKPSEGTQLSFFD